MFHSRRVETWRKTWDATTKKNSSACWVAPRMGKPTQNNSEQQLSWGKWSSKPLDLGFSILSSLCWGFYRTIFSPWNLGGFPWFSPCFWTSRRLPVFATSSGSTLSALHAAAIDHASPLGPWGHGCHGMGGRHMKTWLVVYLPLWKIWRIVSWDYDIPNIWKNTMSKPPTSMKTCAVLNHEPTEKKTGVMMNIGKRSFAG